VGSSLHELFSGCEVHDYISNPIICSETYLCLMTDAVESLSPHNEVGNIDLNFVAILSHFVPDTRCGLCADQEFILPGQHGG
jgi:hypothetical protein